MESNVNLDLQIATKYVGLPSMEDLSKWCSLCFDKPVSITIRFVDASEIQKLNLEYRGKDYVTNVLSFPNVIDFDILPVALISELLEDNFVGDVVICPEVVHFEAIEQNKNFFEHCTHLVVHGCLHLQGFDHLCDEDAKVMEEAEILILNNLGIDNPYTIVID